MKLLIPVEGGPLGDLAVDFVASRAGWMKPPPRAELLHVRRPTPEPYPSLGEEDRARDDARAAHALLDPHADVLRVVGIPVELRHETGDPGRAIVARAEVWDADLLVMASHGRDALGELVLGSVTRDVIVHSHRPVLLLRGLPRAHRQSLRVGVAADEGPGSRAALEAVLANAALFGPQSTLTLVRAEGPPPHLLDTLAGVASHEVTDPSPWSREVMAPLRERAEQAGMRVHEVVLRGWPGGELPRYAAKHLDLLAMGSTARSNFSRAMLGSVTARVAATCGVPLLLARPV